MSFANLRGASLLRVGLKDNTKGDFAMADNGKINLNTASRQQLNSISKKLADFRSEFRKRAEEVGVDT